MPTIEQRIGWTNAVQADVAPTSVRGQGTAFTLHGKGLTVNGKPVAKVTIPVDRPATDTSPAITAETDFRRAIASGKSTVTITRNKRGRPSKSVSMATLATTLGKAPRTTRKPRQSAPAADAAPEAPTA